MAYFFIMVQFDNAVRRFGKVILDELKEAEIKCWIAGGSLRDYFSGLPLNTDYDLFFPNEQEYIKCKEYFIKNDALIKWESSNGMKVIYNRKTFDLIKHYFANPTETIHAFDFTVSMFAVDYDSIYHGETSFIDLAKNQLMINRLPYPVSTLKRAFRYYKKGFVMCVGEMKKLVEAIQEVAPKKNEESHDNNEENPPSGDNGTGDFFLGID